ncbi:lysophospholipid acyltransferase family protein [Thiohalomonas denitrificans]|uniref:lysophospholipid acyltransferase family protein n=1 Tax=Thiohalomonas denitrificans TaxID=415747 RepID=UPI00294FF904|nr:lysophospholipid acyltransferase family protein [Thiohalomonas denitrificans]
MRSLIFYVGLTLVTVIYVVILALLLPFPARIRNRSLTGWSGFVLWWLGVSCDLHFRVEGRENIPPGPAVVLAKHQSAWETIAMQQVFPAQTWVLKRSLLWIPFFGWGLAMTRPVAIDRGAGKKALRQVIEQGTRRLRAGLWMIIFPEGTRVAPGEKGRYAVGGSMLAKQAGVPVVPVAHNAGAYWPKQGFTKKPGIITIAVGPTIDTRDRTAAEVNRKAEAWIESRMATLPTS